MAIPVPRLLSQPGDPARLLSLWFVVATILAHALLPISSPLVRVSGSAFSASTYEVSIAPGRRDKAVDHFTRAGDGRHEASGSAGGDDVAALPVAAPMSGLSQAPAGYSARPDLQLPGRNAAGFRARAPPSA
jgi:hypothetical protein